MLAGDFLDAIWQKMHLSGPTAGLLKARRFMRVSSPHRAQGHRTVTPAPYLNTFVAGPSWFMICERCHAGQMVQYEKALGPEAKAKVTGTRCERCGFILLDNDDDIWAAVGL